jgi:hypothetical protein
MASHVVTRSNGFNLLEQDAFTNHDMNQAFPFSNAAPVFHPAASLNQQEKFGQGY